MPLNKTLMTIPCYYYLAYWIKKTVLVICTGYLISFLIIPIFFHFPYFGLLIGLLYQPMFYFYFYGKNRGEFEYSYQEYLTKREIRSALFRLYGKKVGFEKVMFGKLIDISDDINKSIDLKEVNEKLEKDTNLKFAMYLRDANYAYKEDDAQKMIIKLKSALDLRPDDFFTNFMLGTAYEFSGDSEKAISAYDAILLSSAIKSKNLKEFIKHQKKRVELKGPKKRTPVPGLKYLPW